MTWFHRETIIMSTEDWPAWAKERLKNIPKRCACEVCGGVQSSSFKKCIFCCKHNELELREDWHGTDDEGGWELEVVCSNCGKDSFNNDEIITGYKLVKL